MSLDDLNEWWWPHPRSVQGGGSFVGPLLLAGVEGLHEMIQGDLKRWSRIDPSGSPVCVSVDTRLEPQAYELTIGKAGVALVGGDEAGVFYGQLMLVQYMALHADKAHWPELVITDGPAYERRGAFVDLGRTTSNLEMLKQLVRVYARLRYNELHLRLFDDELCGVRFDGLPFGSENPFALELAEVAALARYAKEHHVELIPEIESWGHVGSLVYHRPDLKGGDAMYGGYSFLAGPESVALVREITRQVVGALPECNAIHWGFDEAHWFASPSAPAGYSPLALLSDLNRVRLELEGECGRELEMRLWADHAGRPLPDDLCERVLLQPWQYWIKNRGMMDKAIEMYAGGSVPWMMTLGQSQAQTRGAYSATRYFCRKAVGAEKLKGVVIAQWGWNDWEGQFLTAFAGAYYAWNPLSDTAFADEQDGEVFDQQVMPKMIWWRSLFDDASDLTTCRGPLVWNGRYAGGRRHGKEVAPTVGLAGTFPAWRYVDRSQPDAEGLTLGEHA